MTKDRWLLENCDADDPMMVSKMVGPDGVVRCRCMICGRCDKHTGNSHQGHYWSYCKVTGTLRDFHMCCPGDCELEV